MKNLSMAFYKIVDADGRILETDYLRVHADASGIRNLVRRIMKSYPEAHFAEYRLRGAKKFKTIANF